MTKIRFVWRAAYGLRNEYGCNAPDIVNLLGQEQQKQAERFYLSRPPRPAGFGEDRGGTRISRKGL